MKNTRKTSNSQSVRTTAILCALAELEQIADNFENWARKERSKYIDPNGVKPPAFSLAQVEDWVNTWLFKQRLVAVFLSNPQQCYGKDDFAIFLTSERKEFSLIIDFFRLHMPAIANSLKDIYDEFWKDVTFHIKCFERSKIVQQENIPSIGESVENTFWHPPIFLDGAVATLVRRLRHIVEMVRQELETETQPARADLASTKQNGEKAKPQAEKLSAKARALAILVEHPDWSDTKIAKEAGINRTTLYDYPEFKAARKIQKHNKEKIPHGSKDHEGNIEAIDK